MGGGPLGSGHLVLGSDIVKVMGICTGQLGGPVVMRFQAVLTFFPQPPLGEGGGSTPVGASWSVSALSCSTLQLVLLVEGSMVRTVDLPGNDAVPSLCSQQVV